MNQTIKIKTKGQKSREKIIQTSIECFFKNGFENTSVQEIADLCSVSQTTVFYHFKNKKVLFSEILKYVISNNRALFESQHIADNCPFEKLKTLLKTNIEWGHKYPEQTSILLQLFSFAATDDEVKVLATETIDRGREIVSEILKEIKAKYAKADIEIGPTSIIIQQYINAVLFQMLVRVDSKKVYDNFHLNLDFYLHKLIFKE